MGFWVVAFPRYLLCYVPLMFFLLSIIVLLDILCASIVKSRTRFLSLALVDCMKLRIYRFFYMVSKQDCFLGQEFTKNFWEYMWKIFRNKFHISIPCENIPKFKKKLAESEFGWGRYRWFKISSFFRDFCDDRRVAVWIWNSSA